MHEAPPSLLHNIGGPPRASIVWRGLNREQAASGTPTASSRTASATPALGLWLHLSISIGVADARYRRDWNTAAALLELVQPDHGLDEIAAQARLVEFIEAETARLDWPPCLIAARQSVFQCHSPATRLRLDHAPLTFVALAKSTGNLWLRGRAVHLAPLHSPTLVSGGGTSMRGVRWDQALWFPAGIPENLIAQAAARKP